ncbi:dsRNA-binding protein [Yokapox virus]|uniref:DsRNA-binding protein n=1 Tax=Yokapox virus TaxID=1076255 RepID=G3EIB5_9POXV|nr:dsRNA-binding protein [Yokapox virus]AEN03626.1 dsRNA-binding protein [Yokapox virus]
MILIFLLIIMTTTSSNDSNIDIIISELEKLDTGITALELSRRLNMEKKIINSTLYNIKSNGGVISTPETPPKWSLNKSNTETDDNTPPKPPVREQPYISDEYKRSCMLMEDMIPYKKLVDWNGVNPITVINEFCQITNRTAFYSIDSSGQSNNPIFYAYVTIDGRRFEMAEGKTKKEAKNKAAKNAVDKLFENIMVKF